MLGWRTWRPIFSGTGESTTVLRQDAPADVADEITKVAEQEQADLIISGAYGYSRMREWVTSAFAAL